MRLDVNPLPPPKNTSYFDLIYVDFVNLALVITCERGSQRYTSRSRSISELCSNLVPINLDPNPRNACLPSLLDPITNTYIHTYILYIRCCCSFVIFTYPHTHIPTYPHTYKHTLNVHTAAARRPIFEYSYSEVWAVQLHIMKENMGT